MPYSRRRLSVLIAALRRSQSRVSHLTQVWLHSTHRSIGYGFALDVKRLAQLRCCRRLYSKAVLSSHQDRGAYIEIGISVLLPRREAQLMAVTHSDTFPARLNCNTRLQPQEKLEEMGVAPEKAAGALSKTDGNLKAALERLGLGDGEEGDEGEETHNTGRNCGRCRLGIYFCYCACCL